jgi:UDP-glucose 4-epimerase
VVLEGKRVLITGGTGSLGQVLVRRLLSGEMGEPARILIFSRDEAKQHYLRLQYLNRGAATDEVIYDNFRRVVQFQIGDIRDYASVVEAVRQSDVVFNAAALKQVPTCEYFPVEAVYTNILGPANVVRAIREHGLPVDTVVGISTDKACKPINAMGMTKALQERVLIAANLNCRTRFVAARYGNVLASRGSVIPLFHDQIRSGGPVTITSPDMTRFLLSLDEAVDVILTALREALPGEIYIPRIPSARVTDVAGALIAGRAISVVETGVRPGEKLHEILVSEEECFRTTERGKYYVIQPTLPEVLGNGRLARGIEREYSSADGILSREQVQGLLGRHGLLLEQSQAQRERELLR